MYRTRTERLKAERKRKRRFLSWILTCCTVLACVLFVFATSTYQDVERQPGLSRSEERKESGQSNLVEEIQDNTSEPIVNLTFVGDVMMAGRVESLLKQKGYDFPYMYVRSLFQQDDMTVANLETPVTNRGTPAANKEYVYKSSPEAIPALKAAGVDLVNLANNHSMDQGAEGLLDTFRVLDENGIEFVGAGPHAERAYSPVYVERNGVNIAFLGFSRVVPEVSWYSGDKKPGIAISYEPTRAVQAIRLAREKADLVIVIAHWGKERADEPVDHQIDLARAYIDAGADLVVGGHPHVLQGFESYKKKWIAYSLGNFIFTRSTAPKTWETMVLQATCTQNGSCQLKMLPFHAELGQAVPMNEKDGAKLLKRMESLSKHVRIQTDGSVQEK
jgi:poly-gamma-glutamate capsule biosynthesis protein CapA/YwtB (metallophosphatase superfamily)